MAEFIPSFFIIIAALLLALHARVSISNYSSPSASPTYATLPPNYGVSLSIRPTSGRDDEYLSTANEVRGYASSPPPPAPVTIPSSSSSSSQEVEDESPSSSDDSPSIDSSSPSSSSEEDSPLGTTEDQESAGSGEDELHPPQGSNSEGTGETDVEDELVGRGVDGTLTNTEGSGSKGGVMFGVAMGACAVGLAGLAYVKKKKRGSNISRNRYISLARRERV